MPFVVDSSVTMAWVLPGEQSDYSERVLRRLGDDAAVVPGIWRLEVINVFLVAERRRRLAAEASNRLLRYLDDLPIEVEPAGPASRAVALLELARRHALSAYDAAYADLAKRRGLPLCKICLS